MSIIPGRELMFSFERYDSWKIRMQAFLASIDDQMMDVITTGPFVPMKVNPDCVANPTAPLFLVKERALWTASDRKRANLDAVCRDIFYRVLDDAMFIRVKNCTTAKQIWEKLIELCEGSAKIKVSKLDMTLTKFKSVRMKDGESIELFEIRVCGIVNELAALGHTLKAEEINRKILQSLSSSWSIKAEIMKCMDQANLLKTPELWSELKAHEYERLQESMERGESSSRNLALAVEENFDKSSRRVRHNRSRRSRKRDEIKRQVDALTAQLADLQEKLGSSSSDEESGVEHALVAVQSQKEDSSAGERSDYF